MRLRLRLFNIVVLGATAAGCSTYEIARDVKLLSLTNEPKEKEVSFGTIEGKSCQWTVLGYPLGEEPSMRLAFENAVKQKDGGAVSNIVRTTPDQGAAKVSILRNVNTGNDFMNLYLVSRACVNVHGLGAL